MKLPLDYCTFPLDYCDSIFHSESDLTGVGGLPRAFQGEKNGNKEAKVKEVGTENCEEQGNRRRYQKFGKSRLPEKANWKDQ